jgi:hypothetical protein
VTRTRPDGYTFRRYLEAKETVDDRALHRPTLERFAAGLADRAADGDPVRVLEVGAGTGSMLRRLLAWECLPGTVRYTAVEQQADLAAAARDRTAAWARENEYAVETGTGTGTQEPDLVLAGDGRRVEVTVHAADAFAFADRARSDGRHWDAAVAAAFLDVVDAGAAIDSLVPLLPGGLVWTPVTFDGVTAFEPPSAAGCDRAVRDRYHDTMDRPDRSGSRTGRRLFARFRDAGARVVAAGGSDWVVHPPYPADEAYFLHHVLETVESAVAPTLDPETDSGGRDSLDRSQLRAWADDRHAAVADGELTYVAHNLDVLARVPDGLADAGDSAEPDGDGSPPSA